MGLCLWLVLGPAAGCSWLVDASPVQCRHDQDCARFAGSTCNTISGVCVAAVITSDGGTGGDDSTDAAAAVADTAADVADTAAEAQTSDAALLCPADGGTAAVGDASPAPELLLLNACSDATCIPFDNHARLHNLASDGTLKPLPDLDGGAP
ncbi:MAG TPA: hypothetical protein VGL59_05430 [Polyangia bacterium]|jgi:hypothetical protein